MRLFCIAGATLLFSGIFIACKNADYQTSPNGLKYVIFDAGAKDSTEEGHTLKMNMTARLMGSKDTLLADTYGKMPFFAAIQSPPGGQPLYDPSELFKQLRKGDSMVAIIYIDSAIQKGLVPADRLPAFMKKGDKIVYTYKVLEVFKVDSLARADYELEVAKDEPRREQEQKEMAEKARKEQEIARKEEIKALEKSGEKAKQIEEIESFLAGKKVEAKQTPEGTFVKVDERGSGPTAADGKYVTVKYTGKKVNTDSTFESSQFTVKLGEQSLIPGFEDGVKQFNQGGKGTIYIPGYLAYGKQGNDRFKPYEPLYFEVEILGVSDTDPDLAQQPDPSPQGAK